MSQGPADPPIVRGRGTQTRGLSEAARLYHLSRDLRTIHRAMLPAEVSGAMESFLEEGKPTESQARTILASILDHSDSLLDALMACREIEPAVRLAAQIDPDRETGLRLDHDFDTLIAQMAGRMGLGALDSILRADALGQLRGLVRTYRLDRVALHEKMPKGLQEQATPTPHSNTNSPASQPAAQSQSVRSKGTTGSTETPVPGNLLHRWLLTRNLLPRRNRTVCATASGVALAIPVFGTVFSAGVADTTPLWSVLVPLSGLAGLMAILTAPLRHAARRPRTPPGPKGASSRTTRNARGGKESAPTIRAAHAASMPPPAVEERELRRFAQRQEALSRQAAILARQGMMVATMDDEALTGWIEQSGAEIMRLIEMARAQSLAADIKDDADNDDF